MPCALLRAALAPGVVLVPGQATPVGAAALARLLDARPGDLPEQRDDHQPGRAEGEDHGR